MPQTNTGIIMGPRTTTGADGAVTGHGPYRTYQAHGTTSAGAGSATIVVEASDLVAPSLDGHWVTLGTITLTLGTTVTSDGFATQATWRWVRGRVSAISGTDATVTLLSGVGGP